MDRIILFGEEHLRTAVREYLAHYLGERNPQGVYNARIDPHPTTSRGSVQRRQRIGGTLSYDYRLPLESGCATGDVLPPRF